MGEKFRVWVKGDKQTNVELASDLCHFNWWCTTADVDNFEDLRELMVLGQFKNSIPQRIATYVAEQKAATVLRAVEWADFAVTHSDVSCGDVRSRANSHSNLYYGNYWPVAGPSLTFKNLRCRDDSNKVCNYCQEPGHCKDRCPVLRSKSRHKPY